MLNISYREIPEGSVETQPGLWAYLREYTFAGQVRVRYVLYASEGYVFYNVEQPENYDEEGNLLPLEDRVYATYASTVCTTLEQVNTNFISVPYEEGYEVVSVGTGNPSVSLA